MPDRSLFSWRSCLSMLKVLLLTGSALAQVDPAVNGYRGPGRDGIYDQTDWAVWTDKPAVLWTRQIGSGYSAVTVYDGKAYTMGHQGGKDVIYCLDPDTGEDIWTYEYACRGERGNYRGPRCTPTVDSSGVYTLSLDGHIICLDRSSGKERWKHASEDFGCKPPTWGFACSPLVLDDKVIYDIGKIIAFDRQSGKKLWETRNFGESYSSPVTFEQQGRTMIAAFPASGLVIVDAENGRPVAMYDHVTKHKVNAAMPIVHDDTVFISSDYGKGGALVKLGRGRLKSLWESTSMECHANSPVLYEGNLYGFSGNVGRGQLRCVDYKTGQVRWSQKGLGCGAVSIADGKLLIQADAGKLVIAKASPDSFQPLAEAQVLNTRPCWTTPVLSNGKIYCRDNPGTLVCLDVSK